jgi:antitoxin MazE
MALIEQCGFGETVELVLENNRLVITRGSDAPERWKEAFVAAGCSADDEIVFERLHANPFDGEEWSW